jgi:hypothetical protein
MPAPFMVLNSVVTLVGTKDSHAILVQHPVAEPRPSEFAVHVGFDGIAVWKCKATARCEPEMAATPRAPLTAIGQEHLAQPGVLDRGDSRQGRVTSPARRSGSYFSRSRGRTSVTAPAMWTSNG